MRATSMMRRDMRRLDDSLFETGCMRQSAAAREGDMTCVRSRPALHNEDVNRVNDFFLAIWLGY